MSNEEIYICNLCKGTPSSDNQNQMDLWQRVNEKSEIINEKGQIELPRLFCLLLGPPGFNCWFSFAPVFQWCCSTPQGSPGVGRNTLFLSSPHLCFIIVFICYLFVSRDDPLMG